MLRHVVNPEHNDWDEHLSMMEFVINDAWQESTCETLFMLNYGQHSLNPLSLETRDHSRELAAASFTQEMQTVQQAKDCLASSGTATTESPGPARCCHQVVTNS